MYFNIIAALGGGNSYMYTKDLGTKTLLPGKVYDISDKLNGVASD